MYYYSIMVQIQVDLSDKENYNLELYAVKHRLDKKPALKQILKEMKA